MGHMGTDSTLYPPMSRARHLCVPRAHMAHRINLTYGSFILSPSNVSEDAFPRNQESYDQSCLTSSLGILQPEDLTRLTGPCSSSSGLHAMELRSPYTLPGLPPKPELQIRPLERSRWLLRPRQPLLHRSRRTLLF